MKILPLAYVSMHLPCHLPHSPDFAIIGLAGNSYGNKRMLGIGDSDPGAEPGASTTRDQVSEARNQKILVSGFWSLVSERGRIRIDGRNKGVFFARHDSALTGQNNINANDNVAFVAANDNNVAAVRAAA